MTVCLGRQAMCESFNDGYSCNCSQTYFKAQKCGIKLYMDKIFIISSIIWQVM